MEITFKARLIKQSYIKEAVNAACKEYKNSTAYFTELDTSSVSDMKAINQVANIYEENRVAKTKNTD